jgi:hypothetical protein
MEGKKEEREGRVTGRKENFFTLTQPRIKDNTENTFQKRMIL